VRLWDAPTGRELATVGGFEKNWVWPVAFSPDGGIVAAGGLGRVHLWSNDGKPFGVLEGLGPWTVMGLAFLPDGRLVSGTRDGTLRLWDARSRKEVRRWDAPAGTDSQKGLSGMAVSPDGRRLAAILDRTLTVRDLSGGAGARVVAPEVSSDQLAFSREGRLAFANRSDVEVVSATDGQVYRRWAGRRSRPFKLLISPNGSAVATLDTDGAARLWDAASLALRHVLSVEAGRWVEGGAFSPDSSRLATLVHRPEVKVWDTRTGRLVLTLEGHTHHTRAVAFSPDGSRIATGGFGGEVRIWDAQAGRLEKEIAVAQMVDTVEFADGGQSVAAGERGEPVRVFDLATGTLSRVPEKNQDLDPETGAVRRRLAGLVPPERQVGGTLYVPFLLVSPDRGQAAVVEFGRPTRMFAAPSGVLSWQQSEDTPHLTPRWSPDGRIVFSADADGLLRARDAATGRVLTSTAVLPGEEEQPTGWITCTPDGYFDGSPGAEAFVRWRSGNRLLPASARTDRRRPDVVRDRLRSR
jgi:WD40 repeat protein